jgi:predicted RNA-binding Zn-ribbon protein involved in translation (DUF1610 family)
MSKSLRLSEKWFHRGLWAVAVVFAGFLIGLGGTVVRNLWKVERPYSDEAFIDAPAAAAARGEIKTSRASQKGTAEALEQAQLRLGVAESTARSERETFTNWLATRQVTARPEQDRELVERTRALDRLKKAERGALAEVEALQQADLDARQAEARAQERLQALEEAAGTRRLQAQRWQDLRIFLYRLAVTLPLLLLAGWLFQKKRRSTWWPFVWGFIFFALFTFFVELVPYLPSYGGYVRYLVGVVVTLLVGRQAILALNRYLERQRAAEQLPEQQRRVELSYDLALSRLAGGVCPGCERRVELDRPDLDFCPHCGIALHDRCAKCTVRKRAFAQFCHACGAPAGAKAAPGLAPPPLPPTG